MFLLVSSIMSILSFVYCLDYAIIFCALSNKHFEFFFKKKKRNLFQLYFTCQNSFLRKSQTLSDKLFLIKFSVVFRNFNIDGSV